MAATHKFAVVVWEDHGGTFTAMLVDEDNSFAALGRSQDEAVLRVKEAIEAFGERNSLELNAGLMDVGITDVTVGIRPVYTEGEESIPCSEDVSVRLPCVHGREDGGMFVAFLPTLGTWFKYYEKDALKGMAIHFARNALATMAPAELRGYLPPKARFLRDITVRVKKRRGRGSAPRGERESSSALDVVAEAVETRLGEIIGGRAWERDGLVADLEGRLRSDRASVLLVGEAGVGKTCVALEAIRRLVREDKRKEYDGSRQHRFWGTGAQRIIAGMRYLGQWQERCEKLVRELSDVNGVLCVDNLLELLRVGGHGPEDSVASFFMPYLRRGELRILGEASPRELDACRRLLPGFADLFQIMNVPPLPPPQAVAALNSVAGCLSRDLGVRYDRATVDMVCRLFRRFMPYAALPGKSVTFMGDLFETAAEKSPAGRVDEGSALAAFVKQTGLPELLLRDEITLQRGDVLEHFRRQVIGQDAACEAAADIVTRFKSGMNDPLRPVGVLLFCGPTGVGKTALTRALADYMFGAGRGGDRLVRLDMSEYGAPGSSERLLSAPGGKPSDLLQKLRQQPFCVVLLDEVEKAHPEVFDTLLNMFDEGRLVDRLGRVTTFCSAVIIMTSNLGARQVESLGFSERGSDYKAEVMSFFRPEFFNRIDSVVTFHPLAPEAIRGITEKELRDLSGREGVKARGVDLRWSAALAEDLAKTGFDPRYGARPLQRTIERRVVVPLARALALDPALRDAVVSLDLGPSGGTVITYG